MEEFRLRDEDLIMAEFSMGGFGAGELNNPCQCVIHGSPLFRMGVNSPRKPISTKWKKKARAKGQYENMGGTSNLII